MSTLTVDTALCDCPTCAPSPSDDMIETLVAAAAEAIRNQAPASLTSNSDESRG